MSEEINQEQGSVQQGVPEKVPDPQAKKQMFSTLLIVALVVFGGIYLIWENFLGAQPDVKINGTQISMSATVQDLLDEGFVLCDFKGNIEDDMHWTVLGKQIYNTNYYIGVPDGGIFCDSSGVRITLVNFESDARTLKDCKIFEMAYYPRYQDDGVEVLIGGKDLKDASLDEWVDFFEEAKYPFDKADMDKFRTGDRTQLYDKKGKYKFRAHSDDERAGNGYKYYFDSLSYTRDIDVTYKTY